MIEVVGVSKTFVTGKGKAKSSVYPLKKVSLTIENGKKVGLIGKSGEGKSTLANILCGVLALDEGQVFLDGKPLYSAKNKYDKKEGVKVQLIPQKPSMALDPTQRIGDAVREALVFSKRAKCKDAREKTMALFDEVGLERTLAKRLPEHLSGGQAQRAVIARALAVNPQTLVCDESTSMLDATTQKNIIELIDALVKERGISVLFISHDEKLVEGFCDDIYAICDGNVDKTR
ncbi:MAG: dipeptide/oligopeptide/nickel ABC transporter ATP-binding protein [Christensenellales bacterium]